MKPYMIFLPALLVLGLFWTLRAYDKVGGMDFFKEKCSFIEAITALKDGHTIRRVHGVNWKYTCAEINTNGKIIREYGILKDDGFKQGFYFSTDDFLANDWIVEKKENK